MESTPNVKCPRCGSENVIIQNRGYSFSQGLGIASLLVVAEWVYTIYINRHAYSALDEYGQYGFVIGLLIKSAVIFIAGLLFGLIGKNKLVARCLKCKSRFDPAAGIKEPEPESKDETKQKELQ